MKKIKKISKKQRKRFNSLKESQLEYISGKKICIKPIKRLMLMEGIKLWMKMYMLKQTKIIFQLQIKKISFKNHWSSFMEFIIYKTSKVRIQFTIQKLFHV